MSHESQLNLLLHTFKKCRVSSNFINLKEQITPSVNGDFATVAFYQFLQNEKFQINKNCVYKIKTYFNLTYLFFLLPNDCNKLLIIGPFFNKKITQAQFLEQAEYLKISPANLNVVNNFLANLPAVNNDSLLFVMLDAYCESVFGDNYSFIDKSNTPPAILTIDELENVDEQSATIAKARIIEERYSFENQLIQAISLGQTHTFEAVFNNLNDLAFNRRIPDVLRDFKNYCITSNTLMRKAAEKGGVHPLYLHSVSSNFAIRIEQIRKSQECIEIIREMFFTYCRLVNETSTKNFSPIVQESILYITNNLQNPLTLDLIAKVENVSKGYLSTIFKKDTGKTITQFICEKRIEQATFLLTSTNLKVQTIAQQCGFLDLQYFSKQFKKVVGVSPLDYKKTSYNK